MSTGGEAIHNGMALFTDVNWKLNNFPDYLSGSMLIKRPWVSCSKLENQTFINDKTLSLSNLIYNIYNSLIFLLGPFSCSGKQIKF